MVYIMNGDDIRPGMVKPTGLITQSKHVASGSVNCELQPCYRTQLRELMNRVCGSDPILALERRENEPEDLAKRRRFLDYLQQDHKTASDSGTPLTLIRDHEIRPTMLTDLASIISYDTPADSVQYDAGSQLFGQYRLPVEAVQIYPIISRSDRALGKADCKHNHTHRRYYFYSTSNSHELTSNLNNRKLSYNINTNNDTLIADNDQRFLSSSTMNFGDKNCSFLITRTNENISISPTPEEEASGPSSKTFVNPIGKLGHNWHKWVIGLVVRALLLAAIVGETVHKVQQLFRRRRRKERLQRKCNIEELKEARRNAWKIGWQELQQSPGLSFKKTKMNIFWSTFISTTLFATFVAGTSEVCSLDDCTNRYMRVKDSKAISEGHNAPYCMLLKTYNECYEQHAGVCRGNLKYHSDQKMINTLLNKHKCEEVQLDEALIASFNMYTDGGSEDSSRPRTPIDKCDYQGNTQPRAHCGLFGDPHLRTFDGQFVTCRVLGAWPLLDTPHLAVQVTNQRVGEDLQATATTKVTAIIKGMDDCGAGRTYEASTDQLPKAFVDGTSDARALGEGASGVPAVWVEEVIPGQHVIIQIRSINATVSVRKIDKYLAVSATMPQEILSSDQDSQQLGLCVVGCPPSEKIDAPINIVMPQYKALELCSLYNLTDYFLDSCVFDLMTTNNSNYRQAAAAAQSELWDHDPVAAASTLKNCTSWPCEWQQSAYIGGSHPLRVNRGAVIGLVSLALLAYGVRS